jgi:hypothetical protein
MGRGERADGKALDADREDDVHHGSDVVSEEVEGDTFESESSFVPSPAT